MIRCEICNTNMLPRSETKNNHTKKHKYYSKMILNRYVIKNVEVFKFKDFTLSDKQENSILLQYI